VELPKKQLPRSLPRYYKPIGTFSCENSSFLGGTRGIVLLSSWVWNDVNGWALEIGISCTYSKPVVTRGRKHTHVAASVKETGDVIAHLQKPDFFWFTSNAFLQRPVLFQYWLLCHLFSRKPLVKAVPSKDYLRT
jgi:hypothetical protein